MRLLIKKLKGKRGIFAVINMLALVVAFQNISTCCLSWLHQPKVPDQMKKLKKF